jgi:PleD family two-component response regulator
MACVARKCRYHSQLQLSNRVWQAPNRRQGQHLNMANILVVDDELGIRDLLSEILNDEGHNVELAENAAQARAARERVPAPTWCCWTSGCPTPMA